VGFFHDFCDYGFTEIKHAKSTLKSKILGTFCSWKNSWLSGISPGLLDYGYFQSNIHNFMSEVNNF
jgi:hypothetical protein